MKILVTGVTGFTGQRVAPLLSGKGVVRCFVRPGSEVKPLTELGYEVAYGELGDPDTLSSAMRGRELLINIASLGFGHAAKIVAAAEAAGISRAVFISTTALFTTMDVGSKQVRQEAEDCIRASKLEWTILRPTMIYGAPDDRNMIRLIRFMDRSSLIPIFGSGSYLQRPIHVEDMARCIVAAAFNEKTFKGEFNVSGKYSHTYNEIVDLTAKALGKRIMKIHIPYRLSLYGAGIYGRFSAAPRLTVEQIMRLNEHKDFGHQAAKDAFGFDPISFEEGIRAEVKLFSQAGSQGYGR